MCHSCCVHIRGFDVWPPSIVVGYREDTAGDACPELGCLQQILGLGGGNHSEVGPCSLETE